MSETDPTTETAPTFTTAEVQAGRRKLEAGAFKAAYARLGGTPQEYGKSLTAGGQPDEKILAAQEEAARYMAAYDAEVEQELQQSRAGAGRGERRTAQDGLVDEDTQQLATIGPVEDNDSMVVGLHLPPRQPEPIVVPARMPAITDVDSPFLSLFPEAAASSAGATIAVPAQQPEPGPITRPPAPRSTESRRESDGRSLWQRLGRVGQAVVTLGLSEPFHARRLDDEANRLAQATDHQEYPVHTREFPVADIPMVAGDGERPVVLPPASAEFTAEMDAVAAANTAAFEASELAARGRK